MPAILPALILKLINMYARTRKFKLATTVYYDYWFGHKMEYQTIRTKRRRAAYLANLSPLHYVILKSKKLWQTSHRNGQY